MTHGHFLLSSLGVQISKISVVDTKKKKVKNKLAKDWNKKVIAEI